MIWDNIVQNIKGIFDSTDNKAWLKKLIEDLEHKISEDKNLPFRIKQIKEKGFIVKVNGLFGFIPFNHMPWRYDYHESWRYVFNYLQDKTLFCRVHKFEKDPLSITINGEVQQFKKMTLSKDSKYEGIIIKKNKYGIYVEFGYSFHWHCGSLVQFIHKSNLNIMEFNQLECGEIFQAIYSGESEDNVAIFQSESKIKTDALTGKLVKVQVRKNFKNQFTYLVEGKYRGTLPISKLHYPDRKKYIRQAISNLNDGEVIHCEVVNITKNKQTLQLKWIIDSEIENAFERDPTDIFSKNAANNINTRLEGDVVDKLKIIGKQVDVEVIKKEDQFGRLFNKYLVKNKYQGELLITNDNYHISNKEKLLIEKSFQNNEILKCTVISIEKNKVKIKWKISNSDFVRFIKDN